MPTTRLVLTVLAVTSATAAGCAPAPRVGPVAANGPRASATPSPPPLAHVPIAVASPTFAPPPPPPPPPDGWTGAYTSDTAMDRVQWRDRVAPDDLGFDRWLCGKPRFGTSYVGDLPCGAMR